MAILSVAGDSARMTKHIESGVDVSPVAAETEVKMVNRSRKVALVNKLHGIVLHSVQVRRDTMGYGRRNETKRGVMHIS